MKRVLIKISGSYGFVGTDWEDEIELEVNDDATHKEIENLAYAEAREKALEQVEYYSEVISIDGDENYDPTK